MKYLLGIWTNSQVSDIYRSDVLGVFANSGRWLSGLVLSVLGINRMNRISLLDNSPLAVFLEETLPCEKIQENIDAGALHALSITASGYGSGHSVTFYQGVPELQPWKRTRRLGMESKIGIEHLLASSAIPFIFPAVHIHREYFGDGSMRQIAPISSALHLGADKVMLIGAWHADDEAGRRNRMDDYPTLAQIAGHALDSIFLDGLEVDLERLQRINNTVKLDSRRVARGHRHAPHRRVGHHAQPAAGEDRRTAYHAIAVDHTPAAAHGRRDAAQRREPGELSAVRQTLLPRIDRPGLSGCPEAARRDTEVPQLRFCSHRLRHAAMSQAETPKPLTFALLRQLADGEFHSGEVLARQVRRDARHRKQRFARCRNAFGLTLYSVRGRGYRLARPLQWLDAERSVPDLGLRARMLHIEILDQAASSNALLLQRAAKGAASGTVLAVEWQSAGRGRLGRTWHSGLGDALTFSLLWRFESGLAALSGLSLAVGVAMMRALDELGVQGAGLKWPNDVLLNDGKLAGILLEAQGDMLGPSAVVIGIGLNLTVPESLRERIDQAVSDLASLDMAVPERNLVLAVLLKQLAAVLQEFAETAVLRRCAPNGKAITCSSSVR